MSTEQTAENTSITSSSTNTSPGGDFMRFFVMEQEPLTPLVPTVVTTTTERKEPTNNALQKAGTKFNEKLELVMKGRKLEQDRRKSLQGKDESNLIKRDRDGLREAGKHKQNNNCLFSSPAQKIGDPKNPAANIPDRQQGSAKMSHQMELSLKLEEVRKRSTQDETKQFHQKESKQDDSQKQSDKLRNQQEQKYQLECAQLKPKLYQRYTKLQQEKVDHNLQQNEEELTKNLYYDKKSGEFIVKATKVLSKITGLPLPDMSSPNEQKKFVDESMAWLKENDPVVDLDELDDETVKVFTKLAGMHFDEKSPTYFSEKDTTRMAVGSGDRRKTNGKNMFQSPVLTSETLADKNNLKIAFLVPKGVINTSNIHEDENFGNTDTGRNSELAKQLRVLQAKNRHLSSEVDSLERKLKMMSDLKGVSVLELRSAMQVACQQEAHNELRNQVLSLQAQLETFTAKKSIQTSNNMNHESIRREMANLQLRLGEREETEEALREELQSLYAVIQEQTSKARKLEAANKQQEVQIQNYQEQAKISLKDLESVKNGWGSLLADKEELSEKLRQAELNLKLEKEKTISLSNQMELLLKLKRGKQSGHEQLDKSGPGKATCNSNSFREDYKADKDLVKALSKITGLTMLKKMTPLEKKKFVLDSVDYLRKNDPICLEKIDNATAKTFTNFAGTDFESPMSVNERNRHIVQDGVGWIQGNDPIVNDDPEEDLVTALSKVSGLPKPEQLSPFQKKKFLYDSIDALRKKDPVRLDTVDDSTAKAIAKLAGIDLGIPSMSPDERKRKAVCDALTFIRKNDPKVDDNPDEDLVRALSTITALPVPRKMTPIEEKRFVVNAVEWLAKNDPVSLETIDDDDVNAFAKLAGMDYYQMHSMSPEERKRKDIQDALSNIRKNDPKVDSNPDNELVKALSDITGLPIADNMTPFEKQKFVYDAVDCLRKNDHMTEDKLTDKTAKAIPKLAGIDYDECNSMSPSEHKRKAMQDALNSIRKNYPKVDENPSDDLIKALSEITGLTFSEDEMAPIMKNEFVKSSIEWLRENEPVHLDTVDNTTAEAFAKLAGIQYNGDNISAMSPDEGRKQTAMKDALKWIRENMGDDGVEGSDIDSMAKSTLFRDIKKNATTPQEDVAELYKELLSTKSKATTLEARCEEQESVIEVQKEQIIKGREEAEKLRKSYDWTKEEHDNLFKKVGNLELELNLESDRAKNLEHQLVAREQDSNLKKDQYDSRFLLQQERITDREQQLSSLYAAFGIIKEECTEQDEERETLKSILEGADSRIAKQLQDEIENETTTTATNITNSPSSTSNSNTPTRLPSPSSLFSPTSSSSSRSNTASRSARNLNMPFLEVGTLPSIMEGYVYKYDKNILKGWKKRYFALYGFNGEYFLTYSTGPLEKIKGTIPIVMGVTTVTQTADFMHQPYVFKLRMNPSDNMVLYVATNSELELEYWMDALSIATEPKSPLEEQQAIDRQLAQRMQQVPVEIV